MNFVTPEQILKYLAADHLVREPSAYLSEFLTLIASEVAA